MKHHKIFLAGKFITTDDELRVINPHTGELAGITYNASTEILEKAIIKAEEIRPVLSALPVYKRAEILKDLSSKLIERKHQIAELIVLESAKPMRYAITEVERSINLLLIAAEEVKRIGIVAGISPFNYPLNLAMHKIAPAIATGCPIILKPASATPLTMLAFAEIIAETELPHGSVSILPMTREVGNKLVTDERIKLLSFTGSPSVGWKMKSQAGKKKVVLELGGNAAVIVTESVNVNSIIEKCIVSAFAYSGQVCIHAQRFYVHDAIFEKFCKLIIERANKLKTGDPLNAETEIASMIDEANAIRVEEWVNEAVNKGAKIIAGGKRKGSFYEPTILTKTSTAMKINCEEVFGPVILIEKYSDFTAAINMVNDSKFGLQAGVFTDSIIEMNEAFEKLDVGGVIINEVPSFRVDHMPYGGIKDSGLGREGVKYAMMDMMEAKLLVKPIN
jgi:glyceraldehyde-3-phosphate dehydrogenase (NADP+)